MNYWLKHVKETMKKNPDKTLKEVLKMAKKTYKKQAKTVKKMVLKKGGGEHAMSSEHQLETVDSVEPSTEGVMEGGMKHVPDGYHIMPNGELMADSAHKGGSSCGTMKGGMKHHKSKTHKTHMKKGGMKHHKSRKNLKKVGSRK